MSKTCAECINIDPSLRENDWTIKYWCDRFNKYVDPKSTECYYDFNEFTDAGRSSREIDNINRGISDGCFVATATCELLGRAPKSDPVLKTFVDFKRNYLKKRPKYYRELLLYEDLGPTLAHKLLRLGWDASATAKNLYKFFIGIKEDIDADRKELAYSKYKSILLELTKEFGIVIVRREDLEESMVYSKKKF